MKVNAEAKADILRQNHPGVVLIIVVHQMKHLRRNLLRDAEQARKTRSAVRLTGTSPFRLS